MFFDLVISLAPPLSHQHWGNDEYLWMEFWNETRRAHGRGSMYECNCVKDTGLLDEGLSCGVMEDQLVEYEHYLEYHLVVFLLGCE